jgi:hypothetical protein
MIIAWILEVGIAALLFLTGEDVGHPWGEIFGFLLWLGLLCLVLAMATHNIDGGPE